MNQRFSEELDPAELLPAGALLHQRYLVDNVLARGTYGITYAGHDAKTGTKIVVKEYFPYALADRAGGNHSLLPKNKACENTADLDPHAHQSKSKSPSGSAQKRTAGDAEGNPHRPSNQHLDLVRHWLSQ